MNGKASQAVTIIASAVLALALYVQWWSAPDMGGDKAWLLATARMWVDGKELYSGLFQPNLPFITWFQGAGVMLAALCGMADYYMVFALTCGLVVISLLLSLAVLAHHPHFTKDKLTLHGLLCGIVMVLWINPAFFSDREHLIVIGFLPYLFRFMPSLALARFILPVRVGVALMAIMALCVKPHAVILFAAVQLAYAVQQRNVRILLSLENLIIYLGGCLYVIAVACFTHDYFSVVLPMLLATYSETNQGITRILPYCTAAFMLAVTLVEFRLRHTSPVRRDIYYLMAACAGGLLYALTNNGWVYTFYPLQSFILLLTAWVWWEFLWLKDHAAEEKGKKPFRFGARACALNIGFNLALVVVVYAVALLPASYQESLAPSSRVERDTITAIEGLHAKSFGIVSASLSLWPEVIEKTGAKMETRFNHLWMLPKIIAAGEASAAQYEDILRYIADGYAQDLNRNRPDVMIVDAGEEFYLTGKKEDLVAYFSRFPAFADAWAAYRLVKTVDYCSDPLLEGKLHKGLCRYDIYQRTGRN